jgi:hypothetical protein
MLMELIRGYVSSKYGYGVAQQFGCTFNCNEPFEWQNESALKYIAGMIYNILRIGIFSEDSEEEIREYYDRLTEHLKEIKA